MIKNSDVAMIILVVSLTIMASFLAGNSLINSHGVRSTEVQKVLEFSSDFPDPSTKIFNDKSINPTRQINIGNSETDKPFTQEENN